MRFSDTITEEQYNELTRLAYERKPDHPDEIQSSINFNELHESIRKIVSNLPIVEFKSSFFNDILDGDQQFYLMTYKEKIFLIDTQGFTYARYVIQLKDLVVLEKGVFILHKAEPFQICRWIRFSHRTNNRKSSKSRKCFPAIDEIVWLFKPRHCHNTRNTYKKKAPPMAGLCSFRCYNPI